MCVEAALAGDSEGGAGPEGCRQDQAAEEGEGGAARAGSIQSGKGRCLRAMPWGTR